MSTNVVAIEVGLTLISCVFCIISLLYIFFAFIKYNIKKQDTKIGIFLQYCFDEALFVFRGAFIGVVILFVTFYIGTLTSIAKDLNVDKNITTSQGVFKIFILSGLNM